MIDDNNAKISLLEGELDKKSAEIQNKVDELTNKIKVLVSEINEYKYQLHLIFNSHLWKIGKIYYKIRDNVWPLNKIYKVIKNYNLKIKEATKIEIIKKEQKIEKNENKKNKLYNKYDILFFSVIDWNFRKQRPQHLANNFANLGHRIFFFSPHFEKGKDNYNLVQINEKISQINLKIPQQVSDYRIYNIDLNKLKNDLMVQVNEVLKTYDVKDAVIIVEYPNWFPIVKLLKDIYNFKIIYDYLDYFEGFTGTNNNLMIENNRKLLNGSDLLIATSDYLKEVIIKNNVKEEKIKIVKNGTEFIYFNKAYQDVAKEKNQVVIGYYGAISDWFDSEKILYIAKNRPNWKIVLIGNCTNIDINEFRKFSNIDLLGEKSYDELISYLKNFDVCLIPFMSDNNLIKATNPVKFYEYLSAGKPVVATKIPELMKYKDNYVYLADNNEEFLSNIEKAINENDKKRQEERINFAKQNDWTNKAKMIIENINHIFPLVSIVIVSYNNKSLIQGCIESIFLKTAYPKYELIIIDNNSDDETKDYLKEIQNLHSKIKVIFNETNEGFAKANNKGIKLSKGKYIILLNNDTIVTKGWISWLIKYLERDKNLKLVGPVTNSIGNEAKINVDYTDINQLDEFVNKYTFDNLNIINTEISVLAMFCIAFEKDLINEIGYLDEKFIYGMFEDDDFSFRIKNNGYKIACVEDAFIHHYGGASFKKLSNEKYIEIFNKNRKIFEEKWGIKWVPHVYREGVK
jgi:GT2 family glycosyltransferase